MEIIRHDDGSLTVPVEAARHTADDDNDNPANPDDLPGRADGT